MICKICGSDSAQLINSNEEFMYNNKKITIMNLPIIHCNKCNEETIFEHNIGETDEFFKKLKDVYENSIDS